MFKQAVIVVIIVSIIIGSANVCFAEAINPSANGVSDVDYCSNDCLMDEDVAQTIALLFVMIYYDG